MFASFGRLFLLGLLLVAVADSQTIPRSSIPAATPNQTSQLQDLSRNLNQAQELIRTGKPLDALALLDAIQRALSGIVIENLTFQEEVLWENATDHIDFAQDASNPETRKRDASIARDRWENYITWYGQLSDAQRAKLPPDHVRINAATRYLGNAIILMEDQQVLFNEYKNIPQVEYLGTDAFDLWKNALYQCPDGRPFTDRTSRARLTKICIEECTGEWLAYAGTLSEWAGKYRLRTSARESYVREANQIQSEAKKCQNPE